MRLETHYGKPIQNPNERNIVDAVHAMTRQDAFIILGFDDMHYMQAAGTVDEGFTLEYQAGGTDRHFVASGGPHSADQVASALCRYGAGDLRWQADFQWEPMDL